MKRIGFFIFVMPSLLILSVSSDAQVLEPIPLSNHGSFTGDQTGKRAVPYAHIREADMMWAKRIWHIIDFRQKINQMYFYPLMPNNDRMNLITILRKGIEDRLLTPYDPAMGDDLLHTMSTEQALSIGVFADTVMIPDAHPPYTERPILIKEDFDPFHVKQIKVKEDWVFDRNRGVMEVRILAICPVIEIYDRNTGDLRGLQDMFWLNFEEARNLLATYKLYNPYNFAQRMSYDDAFRKRFFISTVYKEDNTHDRFIKDYLSSTDALHEAEAIKNKMMEFEHSLWEY